MANLKRKKTYFLALGVLLWLCFSLNVSAMNEIPYSNLYRRISMDFKDAGLKDVLKIFSQQAGLNFVAAHEIEDIKLTLYLDNVGVTHALDKLLSANKLIYELDPESNIFLVKKSLAPEVKTITRAIHIKFIRLPGSPLSAAISSGGESSSGGSASSGGGDIVAVIKNLLSEYGKIDVEPRTNSLVVTEMPERFALIEEMIAKLDAFSPQVMIEVEMLDVSKNLTDKLGVTFGSQFLKVTGAGPINTAFPFWGNELEKGRAMGAQTTNGFKYGTLDASGFNAVFNFLVTDTDTKFLARPRILTLNNETAEIKIATDEAIGVSTTTASAESGGSSTAEPERAETGVVLKVTPQVDMETGEITMFIYPKVSEASLGGSFTSGGQSYQYRDTEERSIKSIIRVKDGETLLIGGLIRTKKGVTRNKVPFFADIPILGMMFRDKFKEDKDRELVVFLTPHILMDSQEANKFFTPAALALDLNREQTLSRRELEVDNLLKQYEIK